MTRFGLTMIGAALLAGTALAPAPALAVFSGDMSPKAESGDKDYAAAIRAHEMKLWGVMIDHLKKVVERRPWHDNAHTLLGYGYRKLGDFDNSLVHYHRALELNPRHRQALAYLAEAYLQMGNLAMAKETEARLFGVCKGMALTFSDGDFSDGCDEYREVVRVIRHYEETGEIVSEEARSSW